MNARTRSLWFAVTLVASACSGAESAASQRLEFRPPWVHFLDGDGMRGALDSTRLRRQHDTTEVWIRFAYAETQRLPNDTTQFDFTELHAHIHCPTEQVREVRMLVRGAAEDSVAGYIDPAPAWQTFSAHPLTEKVLVRLCRKLAGRPVD